MSSSSLFTKETIEAIANIAEFLAQLLAILAAIAGAVYFVANRPLKKIEAEERRQERQSFSERIEELRARNLETESRLEKERATRLELEAAVAPREIRITRGTTERLARAQGTVLHIEYLADNVEAKRLADRIRKAAGWASWQVPRFAPSNRLRDGVEILAESKAPPMEEWPRLTGNLAARELSSFLTANDIDVTLRTSAMYANDEPIILRVGAKPLPRFKGTAAEDVAIISTDTSLRDLVRERSELDDKKNRETVARLRKEWYPDEE